MILVFDLPLTKTWQLDELDAGAKRLLVQVEELKNSQQPIQRLPPDVIVETATYLVPKACGGDCQPLIAMSQVCRYWRVALTSNPESWCFFKSEYMDLVPLFLERSGSYPLEIDLSDAWFYPVVQHIRPHVNRLTILKCHVGEVNDSFLRTLSQLNSYPNLHTFSIISTGALTADPESIETALVPGNMPNLRTLELLPLPVSPHFVQFKHLVDLRIKVAYSTLTSVLDLLAANPSLEKVRLIGGFEDYNDARAAESITLGRLRFLSMERCTPRKFLEKLTFPREARIFIRYNFTSHLTPPQFTLPRSMGKFGLTSLHALMAFTNDTYIDATGPNGSVAIRFVELRSASPVCNAIASLSTAGVTRLVCEFHPTLDVESLDRVIKMMGVLPHLEEIELVHFSGENVQDFLFALKDISKWTKLLRLKFVHCRQLINWSVDLSSMACGRKVEGLTFDTVTIVYKRGERVLHDALMRLEWAVGMLGLVEEEVGEVMRSEVEWDDTSCTTRIASVSAGQLM